MGECTDLPLTDNDRHIIAQALSNDLLLCEANIKALNTTPPQQLTTANKEILMAWYSQRAASTRELIDRITPVTSKENMA